MDIFVGSLPFKLKEEDLKKLFEEFGEVSSVKIIIDKITRQNKGFGFVGMPDDEAALKAIEKLDGSEILGRNIVVNKSGDKKISSPSTNTENSRRYSPSESFGSSNSNEEKGGSRSRSFRTPDKKKGADQQKFSKNKNNKGGKRF